jgi:hypothetical protein
MTIAFLSLFFGLIRGPYPVELAVNGPAAGVELLVDGHSVQKLQAPPWKAEIDFGPDLLPHQIVARALDSRGREIARAGEWINLPHPLAKVDIVLEESKSGPPRAAKVVWTDVKGEKPAASLLTFDGVPLPLDPAGRAGLPPYDLRALHILTAEVDFPSGRGARKEIAYGGEYGSEVSTELTAVPVRTRGGKLPPAGQLGGWLTAGGRPLPIAAVEEGPAQLYVVRSLAGPAALLDLSPESKRWKKVEQAATASRWEGMKLRKEDEVRIVVPFTHVYQGSETLSDLFEILAGLNAWDHGLPVVLLMTGHRPQPRAGVPIRFNDAVAVAGLEATTENRRRAVLLLLSAQEKDQSRYDPEQVRRYLAALRVPLFVWCVGEPEPGSAAAAWQAAWGRVEVLQSEADLKRAFDALRKSLDSQRILMVDGRLLPQSISLTPRAAGVELVGGLP